MEKKLSRRQFLKTSAAGVALSAVSGLVGDSVFASATSTNTLASTLTTSARKKIGPNDKINIGVIGTGGSRGGFKMGLNLAKWANSKEDAEVIAVCDVDALHLREAANSFGPNTAKYSDFRELLERKDIDAVLIATPDHWHAYICIAAMNAGKDVYCEKPLTLTIDEGKKIVSTANRTKSVFQTGSQQRSGAQFKKACELVRNGRVGNVKNVVVRLPGGPTGGPFEVQPVPRGFDWDMWLGPAQWTEYVKERTHGSFRWWLDYSGGMLTDWGAHHIDIAQWGLGTDESGPVSVEGTASGIAIGPNYYNTFPQFNLTLKYENGVTMNVNSQGDNGTLFEGDEGWIFVNRSKIEASDQKLLDDPLPESAIKLYESNDHMQNFLDCMRTRNQPICNAEVGHRSVTICHLCNICLQLGGYKLEWDPKKEEFVNNPKANAMLKREARGNWKV
ncbi:MAG: Gfo/Idh/MocA family oxidoreductase [Armatimonadota bacterium]